MAKPSIRELLGWFTPEFLRHQEPESVVEAGARLAERVEAVLDLHKDAMGRGWCTECECVQPCRTRRALEGE